MKTYLFIYSCGWILILSNLHGQDKPYIYSDPFGNLNSVPADSRNFAINENLWKNYKRSLQELSNPIATSTAYGPENTSKWVRLGRYAILLKSMLELRAFSSQNRITKLDSEREVTLESVDKILTNMNLYYEPNEDKKIITFCEGQGISKLQSELSALDTKI
jgi:hypothetical protein